MKSITNNSLEFQNTNFAYMEMGGQTWLLAAEVGQALGYADDKAIHRIFNRHADEFTQQMTGVVKVTTPGGMQDARMFSLRSAHLIDMFARTPKAKEFRRWVLDILDREVAQGNVNPAFDFKMHVHNINVACIHLEVMRDIWRNELDPALRALGSPIAVKMVDRLDACAQVNGVRGGMERASGLKGLQYH
ncbi:BRO family, N-terminal domain [Buttiauxella agrestis]|uniref:BRO family, N-terminal domain n=1 Tax=Buttiauxella agrestis TaxID=82977 RepID=A0A381CBB8_9ENTR|nr:Bro-N domain-containing protein [Buttiauxella agrestis]SUW64323.1 BRO family, N-terminal domain [Buttiauxella agrestis]